MSDFLRRISGIIEVIDEKIEIERKANELRTLVESFSTLNKKLNNLVWACRFVIGISENYELVSLFKKLESKYEALRENLVKLWGEQPDKIDLLEPKELYEPIDDLIKICRNVESKVEEILRIEIDSKKSLSDLAKTLSVIPDIEIDFSVFESAFNFLKKAGSDVQDLADFVKKDKNICNQKINEWKLIEATLKEEQKKFNLETVNGKKISEKTQEFLKKFINNNCNVEFKFLDSDVVNELKENLPGFCNRLRVRLIDK